MFVRRSYMLEIFFVFLLMLSELKSIAFPDARQHLASWRHTISMSWKCVDRNSTWISTADVNTNARFSSHHWCKTPTTSVTPFLADEAV